MSGSVRHIRPLPSDSSTTIVPVSATAKFAPLIAIRARRNFSRRWSRAASASSRGLSVMPAGAGRPARPISCSKMSRTSARLRWIAGTRMCEGRSWPSWTMSSARSVSQTSIPSRARASLSSISWVAIDLTLTTSVMALACAICGNDPVRLGAIARPVDVTAGAGDLFLEAHQQLGQVAQDIVLERRASGAQLLPVRAFGHGRRTFRADGRGRVAKIGAQLIVGKCQARRYRKWRRVRKAGPLDGLERISHHWPGSGRCASRGRVRAAW